MRVFNAAKVGTEPPGTIYVGRPGIWGNPFVVGKDGTREEVIELYRAYVLQNPLLLSKLGSLVGYDLVCWCYPAPCHADVLIELIEDRFF